MADLMLLPPMRWRFTDEDDVAAYGDRWWPWDEPALTRLRGRDQIALEELVGMPLPHVIDGFHNDRTLCKMAAMWISMHQEGHPVRWDKDFNPFVLTTDWEEVPAVPLGSGEDPTPDSDSSPQPTTESATS